MKGFLAVLLLLMLGVSVFNYMQVQDLKQEVARLQVKVNEQSKGGVSDQVVADATRALARARESLGRMDTATARRYAENAGDMLRKAGRTASEKAAPTLKWLEGQAHDLSRKIQDVIDGKK